MKRIGLIAFVLLVVAISVPVVLIATLPTAKVTITAIGPTGKIGTRTNALGGVETGPQWLFGITNVGRATAFWDAAIYGRWANVPGVHSDPMIVDDMRGTLQPGEALVTNMFVPTDDKMAWLVEVGFITQPTPFQRRLWYLGGKTPGLRLLLPQQFNGAYVGPAWHPVTNAPLASSTVTNTP